MSTPLLNINDLVVNAEDKTIVSGLSLTINPGEVHVLMGPNGSGKSTLSNVLVRHPDYTVVSGSISLNNQDIMTLSPEECAKAGLFMSFQYPIAIPGVSTIQFLKTAVNAVREAQSLPPYDAVDFLQLVRKKMADIDMDESFLNRSINDGFSGGEKKRTEILQMLLLEPKLAVLDEIDSGLDIDALKSIAKGINSQRAPDRAILLVTHYQRLLDYIEPDFVHVMSRGNIVHSGDKTLPKELEEKGYAWLQEGSTV